MAKTLVDLYHRFVAIAFDRQTTLRETLEENGNADWNYDVPEAALTFGKLEFHADILGSFSDSSETWLWSWANRHLTLPASNKKLAAKVRGLAEKTGLDLFASTETIDCAEHLPDELMEIAPHVFAVIAAGAFRFDAYYAMPYEGGCGIALIQDERLRASPEHLTLRMASRFAELINAYPILNHRSAWIGYAASYGLQPLAKENRIRVLFEGGDELIAEFDDLNRLTNLESRSGSR